MRGQLDRQNETVFGENSYLCNPSMKKLIFFVVFLLFTGTNSVVVSLAADDEYESISMPIGDGEENSGEENSEKENKSETEEDDDEVGLDHYWLSREKSSDSNLHFLYQEVLFRNLDSEVVIPPPKA